MFITNKVRIIAGFLLSTTSVFSIDSSQCPINNPADFWATFTYLKAKREGDPLIREMFSVGSTVILGNRSFVFQDSSAGKADGMGVEFPTLNYLYEKSSALKDKYLAPALHQSFKSGEGLSDDKVSCQRTPDGQGWIINYHLAAYQQNGFDVMYKKRGRDLDVAVLAGWPATTFNLTLMPEGSAPPSSTGNLLGSFPTEVDPVQILFQWRTNADNVRNNPAWGRTIWEVVKGKSAQDFQAWLTGIGTSDYALAILRSVLNGSDGELMAPNRQLLASAVDDIVISPERIKVIIYEGVQRRLEMNTQKYSSWMKGVLDRRIELPLDKFQQWLDGIAAFNGGVQLLFDFHNFRVLYKEDYTSPDSKKRTDLLSKKILELFHAVQASSSNAAPSSNQSEFLTQAMSTIEAWKRAKDSKKANEISGIMADFWRSLPRDLDFNRLLSQIQKTDVGKEFLGALHSYVSDFISSSDTKFMRNQETLARVVAEIKRNKPIAPQAENNQPNQPPVTVDAHGFSEDDMQRAIRESEQEHQKEEVDAIKLVSFFDELEKIDFNDSATKHWITDQWNWIRSLSRENFTVWLDTTLRTKTGREFIIRLYSAISNWGFTRVEPDASNINDLSGAAEKAEAMKKEEAENIPDGVVQIVGNVIMKLYKTTKQYPSFDTVWDNIPQNERTFDRAMAQKAYTIVIDG